MLGGPSGKACARRRIVENASNGMVRERYGEAGGKEMSDLELRRTRRNVPHPLHQWQMDAIFSPVAASRVRL